MAEDNSIFERNSSPYYFLAFHNDIINSALKEWYAKYRLLCNNEITIDDFIKWQDTYSIDNDVSLSNTALFSSINSENLTIIRLRQLLECINTDTSHLCRLHFRAVCGIMCL